MLNLSNIKALIVASLWSGVLAGLLLTAVEQVKVIPLLLNTEVYAQTTQTTNEPNTPDAESLLPKTDQKLTFSKSIANISQAIAFALLLGAVGNLRGGLGGWRVGLLWGLAGYAVFFIAPSIGLSAELPNVQSANLKDRQIEWLMTVSDTSLGLWLLSFAKTHTNKFFGAVLLIAPYLMTAPTHVSPIPAELDQSLILANALFWLALGALMGQFYKTTMPCKS